MPSPAPGRAGRGRAWIAALLLALGPSMGLDAAAQPPGAGATPPRPAALTLRDTQDVIDAQGLAEVWVDARGDATIEQVAGPAWAQRFQPARADTIHALGPQAALWIRLRMLRPKDERQDWMVEFPMPVLDRVTVYQADGQRWRGESAGDTLAVETWPEGGRHPFFRLDLPQGQVRDVYARIRHTTAANFPIDLVTVTSHNHRIQLEYLGLGLTFGAFLVLIASCLSQAWIYRDRVYAWYAAYATVTALAVATYTGVAPHLMWPSFGALRDAPQAMLAYFACASALLFVRNIIGIPARRRILDRMIYVIGIAGFLMGLVHPMLAKLPALAIMSAYMIIATVINVGISLSAWRRGDEVGLWVFCAFAPVLVSMAMATVRIFGWIPLSFGTQYAVVFAMAIEVPLLLVALSIRSRERHGAQIREQALSTQDALTGLLAPHLFHDRMRQVVARFRRDREGSAVIFIDLVNYPRIKEYYGSAVAEQSLLRSVIKLRRLLRDVDTVSRIGESRFGVILEGVSSRVAVTDRAARLIAAGLMPLKGLKPDVTLQFHIAAVLLEERMLEADELSDALGELLRSMSPRTRRPIRFLQPDNTQPAGLQDSSLLLQEEERDSQLPAPEKAQLTVVR